MAAVVVQSDPIESFRVFLVTQADREELVVIV
jgi:hypothetical protein